MRATINYGTPVMFRAHYVASINPELCRGCRECMRLCQFGAIGYSVAQKKAGIDIRRCYGCGICRSVCIRSAITLLDRNALPEASKRWQRTLN